MSGLSAGGGFGFLPPRGQGGEPPEGMRPRPADPVFLRFFFTLRKHGLKVSHHEWFSFLRGLAQGLAQESLTGLYHLGRITLVKRTEELDLYDLAFAEFFRGMAELPGEVREAIERWLAQGAVLDMPPPELPEGFTPLDLEALIRRFEEKLKAQDGQHDGGSEWIGTQGTSPHGRYGRHPGGIRVGGEGGGRQAVKIAERRLFRDYRSDRILDIRQIRFALRRLRDLVREGPEDELDLDDTVERTGKNAGEVDLAWKRPRKNSVKLLLLLDVGGSMTPYAELVSRLFSGARQERHWRRLEHLYFHNCVYASVYKNAAFTERVPTVDVLREHEQDWKLVIVGDACMASSELYSRGGSIDWFEWNPEAGIDWLRRLSTHFRKTVWLNPMTRRAWDHPTVRAISVLFPMYELTLDGLGEAVGHLRGRGA